MSLRTQFWICALLAFGCCSAIAAPPDEYDVQEALYDEPIDESVESGAAETEFPYKAYINGDSVHVRSGPGQNYYTVLKMKRSEPVYVYRHDPGGWCAIRPPPNVSAGSRPSLSSRAKGAWLRSKETRSSRASAAPTAIFAT